MSARTRRLILGVVLVSVLGACGQKGPLYLPEHNGVVVTRTGDKPPATPPNGSTPAPKKDDDSQEKPH